MPSSNFQLRSLLPKPTLTAINRSQIPYVHQLWVSLHSFIRHRSSSKFLSWNKNLLKIPRFYYFLPNLKVNRNLKILPAKKSHSNKLNPRKINCLKKTMPASSIKSQSSVNIPMPQAPWPRLIPLSYMSTSLMKGLTCRIPWLVVMEPFMDILTLLIKMKLRGSKRLKLLFNKLSRNKLSTNKSRVIFQSFKKLQIRILLWAEIIWRQSVSESRHLAKLTPTVPFHKSCLFLRVPKCSPSRLSSAPMTHFKFKMHSNYCRSQTFLKLWESRRLLANLPKVREWWDRITPLAKSLSSPESLKLLMCQIQP